MAWYYYANLGKKTKNAKKNLIKNYKIQKKNIYIKPKNKPKFKNYRIDDKSNVVGFS